MKIRSITDVITNSSTEVFAMISPRSVDRLKTMINLLLVTSGSTKTCDDLFDIHLEVSEWAEEGYCQEDNNGIFWEDMTDQEKLNWCLENADYDSYTLYPKVKVSPKSPDIPEELIHLLESAVDCGLTPVEATFG